LGYFEYLEGSEVYGVAELYIRSPLSVISTLGSCPARCGNWHCSAYRRSFAGSGYSSRLGDRGNPAVRYLIAHAPKILCASAQIDFAKERKSCGKGSVLPVGNDCIHH